MSAPLASALLLLALATASLAAVHSSMGDRRLCNFFFYNKENAARTKGFLILRDLDPENIIGSGFNPELPTKILIHGFANGVASASMQTIKDGYFKSDQSVNVIILDWETMPFYPTWFLNVRGAATRLAEFLDFMAEKGLLKLEKLHIIGHSLGAHVAGIAGELVTAGRIGRITGLDPARPLFNMKSLDGRLSKDDAELVDVIHTNGGGLGEVQAVGHVDFYPNGGKVQPGCEWDMTGACSHGRSHWYFVESIENPKAFQGWKCEDEWDAVHLRCDVSDTFAYLGDKVEFSEEGAYYLETNGGDKGPYGLGPIEEEKKE